jgi:hypothetical protein
MTNITHHYKYAILKKEIEDCWKFTTIDLLKQKVTRFHSEVKGTEFEGDSIDLIVSLTNRIEVIYKPFTSSAN